LLFRVRVFCFIHVGLMNLPIHSNMPPYEAVDAQAAVPSRNLPIVQWLVRSQWTAAILAVVVLFGYFILPRYSPQPNGGTVQIAVLLLLLSLLAVLFWFLRRAYQFARQEILLREAFHGVLTPQVITDAAGHAVLSNRAFDGWVDVDGQNAETMLSMRFTDTTGSAEAFMQISETARSGQVAVAELPVRYRASIDRLVGLSAMAI
jgi:hypothetical protein